MNGYGSDAVAGPDPEKLKTLSESLLARVDSFARLVNRSAAGMIDDVGDQAAAAEGYLTSAKTSLANLQSGAIPISAWLTLIAGAISGYVTVAQALVQRGADNGALVAAGQGLLAEATKFPSAVLQSGPPKWLLPVGIVAVGFLAWKALKDMTKHQQEKEVRLAEIDTWDPENDLHGLDEEEDDGDIEDGSDYLQLGGCSRGRSKRRWRH